MKVVLFCGGDPLQLATDGAPIPKPMIRLGNQPVLWHVMRQYASWGLDDFIVCLGRGGDQIKRFFLSYQEALSNDFVLDGAGGRVTLLNSDMDSWRITFADTGMRASVLHRLRAVRSLVETEAVFCASYGDVLTDAPIDRYLADFLERDELAAVVALRPRVGLRLLDIGDDGGVAGTRAMEASDLWMAGGYFFFRVGILEEIGDKESLLDELLPHLIANGQLHSYRYSGFWSWTDTLREVQQLETLERQGNAPWRRAR